MDIMDVIRTRRTVGKSRGDLSRDAIAELIEAATWAPNHKLTQPWRFSVLAGAAREYVGDVWARSAAAGMDEPLRSAFIAGESRKLLRSPNVIVVSTRTDADPVRAEEDLTATAAAVQNMLLAAHARGFSAAWKTGKIVYDRAVKACLGLDPTDRIVAFVYLGATASEEPLPRERDAAACVQWISPLTPGVGGR